MTKKTKIPLGYAEEMLALTGGSIKRKSKKKSIKHNPMKIADDFPQCSKNCKTIKELGAGECENVCPEKFKKIADEKALKILDILEEQFCVSLRELGITEGVIICLKDQALKEILKLIDKENEAEEHKRR